MVFFLIGSTFTLAMAQVPPLPITSSGLNTQVSAPVNLPGGAIQHNITGGTRPGGGGNLFHSFGEFGIPTNNIANFLNDAALPTSNILSRVTGGNPSNILGTIQTEGFGNANLFLMNPAGIVFGPDASLNVGGSTHFTTADYLRLADGVQFTALPGAQDALLSIAPVAAFGFLGPNPGAIAVEGSTLSVSEGQTLSLVGGDITIGGSLNALSGKIAIASVGSSGEVLADTYASAPNVNGESFTTMGNISLLEGATLDVSGDAAGTVIIRGGELMMANALISADTVDGDGAPVAIDIDVTSDVFISTVDGPAFTARTTGTGNAGEIKLSSRGAMDISGTGFFEFLFPIIDTHSSGPGNAGNVTIASQGDLTAVGDEAAFVFLANTGTEGFDTGEGGDISLTAQNFDGRNFFISTGNFFSSFLGVDGAAPAGDVTISVAEKIDLTFVDITTDSFDFFFNTGGNGGNVAISAQEAQIEVSNISTAGWFGGGNVTFNTDFLTLSESTIGTQTRTEAGGAVTFTGKKIDLIGSSIVSTTNQNANAGDITITATEGLSLLNTGVPFTGERDIPSSIASNAFLEEESGILGAPGSIRIVTPTLVMEGGSKINSSSGSSGNGGPVIINAKRISMSGQTGNVDNDDLRNFGAFQSSGIFTGSLGGSCSGPCGNAGDVNITTESLLVAGGAQINSSTSTDGGGGAVIVNARDTISISGVLQDGTSGGVFSRTTGTDPGSGAGGSISLMAGQNFTLSDGATVSASTEGPGQAGGIAIAAGTLILAQGGTVDSGTTSTGAGGAINVNASGNMSISGASSGVFSRTTGTELGSGAGGTILLASGQNFTLSARATVSGSSEGPGQAGDIAITAGAFTIAQGGRVDSGTTGTGQGGSIQVNASGNMSISGSLADTPSGVFSRTTGTEPGSGAGGTISLMAGQNFTLSDGATVSASSSGPANAGNITIGASDTILIEKATVTTDATQASGGNIKLTATDTIHLVDSTIESSVQGDVTTAGGDISLDPDFIILQNSQILAKAVEGQGGNISLVANDVVLVDPFSVLDASSALGISGSVDIQAPTKFLSGTIAPLPQDPAPVTNLYGTKCVAGAGGHFSTFVDSKTDSLAPTPGTFLASPFLPLLNSSQVAWSGDGRMDSKVSETSHVPHLQVAAYSPPVLFGHSEEMLTACP